MLPEFVNKLWLILWLELKKLCTFYISGKVLPSFFQVIGKYQMHIFVFFRYGSFRLIDIPGLREVMPITMEEFLKHVEKSTKAGVEKLRFDWLPECCAIVDMKREEVEKWMPQDNDVSHAYLLDLLVILKLSFCFLPFWCLSWWKCIIYWIRKDSLYLQFCYQFQVFLSSVKISFVTLKVFVFCRLYA